MRTSRHRRTSEPLTRLVVALAVMILLSINGSLAFAKPDDADHFEKKIRPLLLSQCVSCHGPDKVKGRLRLDSAELFAKGGVSGPIVTPGRPDESTLIRAVRQGGDLKMPPGGKLKDQEI